MTEQFFSLLFTDAFRSWSKYPIFPVCIGGPIASCRRRLAPTWRRCSRRFRSFIRFTRPSSRPRTSSTSGSFRCLRGSVIRLLTFFFFFFLLGFGPGQLTNFISSIVYEVGFYKPTVLKVHPPICRITAYATMPGYFFPDIMVTWLIQMNGTC